jgi:hypothetical protein
LYLYLSHQQEKINDNIVTEAMAPVPTTDIASVAVIRNEENQHNHF